MASHKSQFLALNLKCWIDRYTFLFLNWRLESVKMLRFSLSLLIIVLFFCQIINQLCWTLNELFLFDTGCIDCRNADAGTMLVRDERNVWLIINSNGICIDWLLHHVIDLDWRKYEAHIVLEVVVCSRCIEKWTTRVIIGNAVGTRREFVVKLFWRDITSVGKYLINDIVGASSATRALHAII